MTLNDERTFPDRTISPDAQFLCVSWASCINCDATTYKRNPRAASYLARCRLCRNLFVSVESKRLMIYFRISVFRGVLCIADMSKCLMRYGRLAAHSLNSLPAAVWLTNCLYIDLKLAWRCYQRHMQAINAHIAHRVINVVYTVPYCCVILLATAGSRHGRKGRPPIDQK